MESLTVKDLKIKKEALEKEITGLVEKFEKEYDVLVSDISIEWMKDGEELERALDISFTL